MSLACFRLLILIIISSYELSCLRLTFHFHISLSKHLNTVHIAPRWLVIPPVRAAHCCAALISIKSNPQATSSGLMAGKLVWSFRHIKKSFLIGVLQLLLGMTHHFSLKKVFWIFFGNFIFKDLLLWKKKSTYFAQVCAVMTSCPE